MSFVLPVGRHLTSTDKTTKKGHLMSRVFLTMAMSLDGFITGPDDDAENPAGINGMRLMDWLSTGSPESSSAESPMPSPRPTTRRTVAVVSRAT